MHDLSPNPIDCRKEAQHMSKLISLKEKLNARQNVLGTTVSSLSWSGLIQKLSLFPLDFLLFDLEHGTLSAESIEEMLRMCRLTDLPSIVRVQDSLPHLISKPLDMGADGVLIPRVESLEQVEIAVRAARYYPRGRKGCGGFSNLRAEDNGSVLEYNDNRLIFIQMESAEGLEALPGILKKYASELAGVIIGPYDTSIMLGTPLDITSDVMTEYIRDVFACCAEYGVSCGSFVDHAGMFERYRELGGNIFWTSSLLSLMLQGVDNLCTSFSEMNQ